MRLRKIPFLVNLDIPLLEWLDTEAVRRGISRAELIRLAIKALVNESTPVVGDDTKKCGLN